MQTNSSSQSSLFTKHVAPHDEVGTPNRGAKYQLYRLEGRKKTTLCYLQRAAVISVIVTHSLG